MIRSATAALGRWFRTEGPLFAGCFLVFALTRWILFAFFDSYISDTYLYQRTASTVLGYHGIPYCDAPFPYPPFSLPFIYAPYHFAKELPGYRRYFRFLMCLVDAGTFLFQYLFIRRRLAASGATTFIALALSSFLALLSGHVIFDRIDPIVSVSLIGALYFFTGEPRARPIAYCLLLYGTLVKFVPIFVLPIFAIFEMSRRPPGRRLIPFSKPFVFVLVPAALFLIGYDRLICNSLLDTMADQSRRGIQVESIWATPFMIMKSHGIRPRIGLDMGFGAVHLDSKTIPAVVVSLSKSAWLAIMGAYFWTTGRAWLARRPASGAPTAAAAAAALYGAIAVLIVTQRVLSPQFFVWLLPSIALLWPSFRSQRPFLLLFTVALFGFTYYEFDLRYVLLISFEAHAASVVAARNVLLVLYAAFLWRLAILSTHAPSDGRAAAPAPTPA